MQRPDLEPADMEPHLWRIEMFGLMVGLGLDAEIGAIAEAAGWKGYSLILSKIEV